MEQTLFEQALAKVDGRRAELARRCGVTPNTIQNWKVLDDDHLPVRARLALKAVVGADAS